MILHIKDRKNSRSVVKGLSDARIKVDSHTKDDACMAYMMMWHEVKIIVAL